MVSRVDLRWVSASITEECYYELLFTSQADAWRVGLRLLEWNIFPQRFIVLNKKKTVGKLPDIIQMQHSSTI